VGPGDEGSRSCALAVSNVPTALKGVFSSGHLRVDLPLLLALLQEEVRGASLGCP
jgi:hypothetical protein